MGPNENWPWILLCGSGPSLRKIDPFLPGCPIVCVSTAIRYIPKPHAWVSLDGATEAHGPQGTAALHDPGVIKVFRDSIGQRYIKAEPSVRCFSHQSDKARTFMDGNTDGMMNLLNRTTIFAVQWCCVQQQCKNLIFAGFDLLTSLQDPYCYPEVGRQDLMQRNNQAHLREFDVLKGFHQIAITKGVRFLSWTPGSKINEFMEPFRSDSREVLLAGSLSPSTTGSYSSSLSG